MLYIDQRLLYLENRNAFDIVDHKVEVKLILKKEAFTERNGKKVYLMVTYSLVLNTTIPLIG